jgi:hypothetical protein
MNSADLVGNNVKTDAGNVRHYINEWKGGCPWCNCHKVAHDSQMQMATSSAKLANSMEEGRV